MQYKFEFEKIYEQKRVIELKNQENDLQNIVNSQDETIKKSIRSNKKKIIKFKVTEKYASNE
jgi:hypothetical protein